MDNPSKPVVLAALAGNAGVAVSKFVAAYFSGSAGMLSEGIHSVVDTANQALLLYGLHRAKKPPDEEFPFGYGKEIYFWSFVVAFMLFMVGAVFSVFEGVQHIVHQTPVEDVLISYVVLGIAMLFEGASWAFALFNFSRLKGRRGYVQAIRHGKDPTTFLVLFEDTAALLGIVVAFLGIYLTRHTGIFYFDGIASILIGLILGVTAALLGREVKGLLIGESANRPVVRRIRRLAEALPQVRAVNEVLTMHVGPEFILVNVSVAFVDDLNAVEIAEVVSRLDAAIKRGDPRVKKVFIEAETAFLASRPVQRLDQQGTE